MLGPTSFSEEFPPSSAARRSRFGLFIACCLVMVLAACEDPSNVGLGLIGEGQGGQPVIRQADPSSFENAPLVRPGGSQPRILAGRVIDPLTGTIAADGYFDLSSGADSDFRDAEVTSASLRLRPTYVYGDTTETVTFAVRPLLEEFNTGISLPSDTTFSTDAAISEFSFLPNDTLVIVPMPQTWVDANDPVLRSDEFSDEFHGFLLEQVSGNAVIGFAGDSQLRAFAEADSAVYPVTKAYAAIRRTADPNLPPNRLLYQAGTGPIARFEMGADTLNAAAINQARFVFQTDTLALSQKPAGFRRPVIATLDLYATVEDGRLVVLDRAELDDQGRFIFDGTAIALELQRVLLGAREIDHFEIRIPVGSGTFGGSNISPVQGSIDAQIFYDSNEPDKAPAGYLTITPID